MEAPDKAYILIEELGDVFMLNANTWDNGGEQYIRKDALLEWLESKAKVPDSFVSGLTYLAYKDVIDKLNSM